MTVSFRLERLINNDERHEEELLELETVKSSNCICGLLCL